jgi:hypothetical protein
MAIPHASTRVGDGASGRTHPGAPPDRRGRGTASAMSARVRRTRTGWPLPDTSWVPGALGPVVREDAEEVER